MSLGHNPGPVRAANPYRDEQIREELDRVLASHEFRSSKRSQEFLRYVIENTLNGHGDTLKERTIGIEVFGRPTSYDPSDDATVRVKAGEVRKRLGCLLFGRGRPQPHPHRAALGNVRSRISSGRAQGGRGGFPARGTGSRGAGPSQRAV